MKTNKSKKLGTAKRKIAGPVAPPSIQKILAATDFSNESRAGVRYAVALAAKLKATVELLHVIEPVSRLSGMEAVILAREDSELMAQAHQHLAALAKRKRLDGVTLTATVRAGKPFHEITTTAQENQADLTVIATHGYTGAKHILLGSTAEQVVRHATGPVLTVPTNKLPKRPGPVAPLAIRQLLVPIDFSAFSNDALPWATFLATQFNAELVLIHVVERFPIDYFLGRELMSHTIVPLMKQAEDDLQRLATELGKTTGLKVRIVVHDGKPFEEICRAAKALATDMIVLTTHGYTGLKHVWLGSTAERIVRHAPCPVLVVRKQNQKPL
jgi:nucleotide-binding universal stress UspA family protein